ncbi:MAG: hydantoinase B/oxoprolinase family protein [bacterium]
MTLGVIELGLFSSRINAVCDEMGSTLKRAAFSPNIRDRLDFSCAVFDAHGQLCAQAAHIPVHLGSMAYAMGGIIETIDWHPGDMLVVNDPYLGGTHLPDVTLIAPVFADSRLVAFVANRAHHANIGADSPGSMPLSRNLEEEGIVLEPQKLISAGSLDDDLMDRVCGGDNANEPRTRGDFFAQISANKIGAQRLAALMQKMEVEIFVDALEELNHYGERVALAEIARLPKGVWRFSDVMDDDGMGNRDIPIAVTISIENQRVLVDFSGTADQVDGNINCPLSVAAAAVFYVFRCLMPDYAPACAGLFRPIQLSAPEGCLVNARRPAAVAAGNVETSSRITDVVIGALAQAMPDLMPAASHGSMNNLAMGNAASSRGRWDYYETIGGGMGAHALGAGLSGVQTHMTNTLNTPIEVLESNYPLRVRRYGLRDGSGGDGAKRGGEGIVREFEFLEETSVTLLTERRSNAPWGLRGGQSGEPGVNLLNGELLPGKCCFTAKAGDVLTVKTAGAGGYGVASGSDFADE